MDSIEAQQRTLVKFTFITTFLYVLLMSTILYLNDGLLFHNYKKVEGRRTTTLKTEEIEQEQEKEQVYSVFSPIELRESAIQLKINNLSIETSKTDEIEGIDEKTIDQMTVEEKLLSCRRGEWDFSYTEEDVKILGDVMYAEVGVFLQEYDEEPIQIELVHKLAGSAFMNRVVNEEAFEDTMEGVLNEQGQYATRTKNSVGNIDTPEIVYEWARDILENGPLGPKNFVFQDSKIHGEILYEYENEYFCISNKLDGGAWKEDFDF